MDPTDCYITVKNGELLTGQLDKAALGLSLSLFFSFFEFFILSSLQRFEFDSYFSLFFFLCCGLVVIIRLRFVVFTICVVLRWRERESISYFEQRF
jgi:phosphate starvation-inducible membrane PsiE